MMLPLPYLQAMNETAWDHNKRDSFKVIFFCLSQCYCIMASRSIKSVHSVMFVLEIRSADMRSEVCLGNVEKSSHNLPASAAAIFSQDFPFPLASWFLSHSLSPFFLLLPVSDINFSLGIHHGKRKGKHCSAILCGKKKKHFCAIMLEQNILKYISAFIYLLCVYSCPCQHMTLLPYPHLFHSRKQWKQLNRAFSVIFLIFTIIPLLPTPVKE